MPQSPSHRTLISTLAARTAINPAVAKRVVQALPDAVFEALAEHGELCLRGLGRLQVNVIPGARRLLCSNLDVPIDPDIGDRIRLQFRPSRRLEDMLSTEILDGELGDDMLSLYPEN